ncbi:hypothetical protein EDEG_02779 [Edhazardia aedis USNM 41457]|uniref:Tetratricopeptide repeat protein n=1 Tax=Edhazardia aedis (strain USNM 41457) TaxID=1003232 RepID=J8ZT40_EDHAE|nr:hypothetical protein EDEG_02779 [Edhazardia aedis USNM 41457]|eukprot:EJW02838.1 hypothetical protein EDEG_02779 [Edhazardia aedis USNM 41457]
MSELRNICYFLTNNVKTVKLSADVDIVVIPKIEKHPATERLFSALTQSFNDYFMMFNRIHEYGSRFNDYKNLANYFQKAFRSRSFEKIVFDFQNELDQIDCDNSEEYKKTNTEADSNPLGENFQKQTFGKNIEHFESKYEEIIIESNKFISKTQQNFVIYFKLARLYASYGNFQSAYTCLENGFFIARVECSEFGLCQGKKCREYIKKKEKEYIEHVE